MNFGPNGVWGSSKSKQRRPLSSIILQEGVIQSLVEDAREFIRSEDWYTKAGIPHRRGYLLHGPPGTGKSGYCPFMNGGISDMIYVFLLGSTIYAVAGELGLEIYSLSLASSLYVPPLYSIQYVISDLTSLLASTTLSFNARSPPFRNRLYS